MKEPTPRESAYRVVPYLLWLSVGFPCAGLSQSSVDTVQWAARVTLPPGSATAGDATLELSGAVKDGWHVYAFTQLPGGPTALRVTVDDDKLARLAGAPAGTAPEKIRDRSFGLETQFYTHAFLVELPLRLGAHAANEKEVPISVRFQTCNDRECQPPRTVHVVAPIDTQGDRSLGDKHTI
jgi:hypothetical protein